MGKWIKRHKALFIVLCVLLSLGIGITIFVSVVVKNSKAMLTAMMSQETASVERRDLVESISATGIITSSDMKTVIVPVTGVDIAEVNIAVGDQVKAGDLICVFDSADLEENLEMAQKSLANAAAAANMSVDAARRQYNEAVASVNSSKDQYDRQVAAALDAMNSAKSAMDRAGAEYNKANEAVKSAEELVKLYKETAAYKTYQENLEAMTQEGGRVYNAEKEYIAAKKALEEDEENPTLLAAYNAAAEDLKNAKAVYMALQASYDSVPEVQAYNTAVAAKDAVYAQYTSLVSAYNSAKSAYDAAVTAANNAASTAGNMVASAKDGLTNASNNAETATYSLCQQVDALEEQIAACKVYAPISGVVTSVNVSAGDKYAGSVVAVIEDNYTYEVSTQISEYDIGKIKVGQQVVIKTNGTGDKELLGTVKTIAPRATPGATVAYGVTVTVDTPCEELKLDMTAKMSIIINSTSNTLTVPYESVITDDDGRTYVEVTDGSRSETGAYSTKKVYVTTGIESDYYIEIISDEIKEGTTVVVPRTEFNAFDIYSLLYEEGADAGL